MPLDQLLVFTNESGNSPLMDWLGELRKIELRAYAKCLQEIRGLTEFAHETPERVGRNRAKRLRDGICELRAKHGKVRYRVLYFFCGKAIACLSHGFKKGGKG